MSRKSTLLMLLLLFQCICEILCLGINNFHFPLGNMIRGNVPIAQISISGSYNMIKSDYPPRTNLNITRIKGAGPWVCLNEGVISKIMGLEMSNTTYTLFDSNLQLYVRSLNATVDTTKFKLPINITNCTKVPLDPQNLDKKDIHLIL